LNPRMLNHTLRYARVAVLLSETPKGTLLEVGSGGRGVNGYLPAGWHITACDVSFNDYGSKPVSNARGVERVTASVLNLPFADRQFDCVLALDLLEHLAPADRLRATRELRRVARHRLIVGCPIGPAAERADKSLAAVYRTKGLPLPEWLAEHLGHGLPQLSDLLAGALADDTVQIIPNTAIAGHERVTRWESRRIVGLLALVSGTVLAEMIRRPGFPRRVATWISWLCGGRDHEPAYRQIAVIVPTVADLAPTGGPILVARQQSED